MLEASRQRILRSLAESDLVLDVGGGGRPFERADWVLDLMTYEDRGLYAYESDESREHFTPDTWVTLDACGRVLWPFSDRQFDFAVCSHTLEDLRDPLWVCSELMRVSKAGYIEVPSRLEEQSWGVEGPYVGWSHHRWLIEIEEDCIAFFMKHHVIHRPGGNHFPAGFRDSLTEEQRVEAFFWEGSITCRERVFFSLAEVEVYLSEFVSQHLAAGGGGGLLRRLRRSATGT